MRLIPSLEHPCHACGTKYSVQSRLVEGSLVETIGYVQWEASHGSADGDEHDELEAVRDLRARAKTGDLQGALHQVVALVKAEQAREREKHLEMFRSHQSEKGNPS